MYSNSNGDLNINNYYRYVKGRKQVMFNFECVYNISIFLYNMKNRGIIRTDVRSKFKFKNNSTYKPIHIFIKIVNSYAFSSSSPVPTSTDLIGQTHTCTCIYICTYIPIH